MATWKARVIEVSQIDAGARQEAKFNIIRPNGQVGQINGQAVVLSTTGNPTNIRDRIAQVAADFIREFVRAGDLKVNDEVEFEI